MLMTVCSALENAAATTSISSTLFMPFKLATRDGLEKLGSMVMDGIEDIHIRLGRLAFAFVAGLGTALSAFTLS